MTANHIAAIHVLKARLRLTDEDYRALLNHLTGHTSSKDCTPAQQQLVRDHLQRLAEAAGVASPQRSAGFEARYQAASARNSPPAELLAVVRDGSVRQAADALRLSVGLIHQLRAGYWPDDPRRILRAWAAYRGRTARVESSWFLRRVRAGGVVPHAGRRWSGVGLQQHVGELVAVSRMPDGALLAQTLELPAQRLPLEALP